MEIAGNRVADRANIPVIHGSSRDSVMCFRVTIGTYVFDNHVARYDTYQEYSKRKAVWKR